MVKNVRFREYSFIVPSRSLQKAARFVFQMLARKQKSSHNTIFSNLKVFAYIFVQKSKQKHLKARHITIFLFQQ